MPSKYLFFDVAIVTDNGIMYKKTGLAGRAEVRDYIRSERRYGQPFTAVVLGVTQVDPLNHRHHVSQKVWSSHYTPLYEENSVFMAPPVAHVNSVPASV